jgi:hypothetical protein
MPPTPFLPHPIELETEYGTSENAVKSQIWTAMAIYVLVAIIKKKLDLRASLSN